jgi:glycosyltransferase involved in cell wall biosynthesis
MEKSCHLKILHIASGDLWAGAEVQLFTLAKTLHNRLGAIVSVVLLNHGTLEQKLREAGIQVVVIDESTLNGFQILRQLVHTIREQCPDVIHTHRIKENIFGSIAARLNGSIPSLRTAHGAPEHRPSWYHIPKRLILFLDWFCGRFLQRRIIAVSDDLAKILNDNFPPDQIRVIENGIDMASLTQSGEKAAPQPSTAQAPFKVGIAGRLVPVKRVDLFIKTARYLLDHHPDLEASFHIFGDGPLREELEALNHELKTGDIVHFEGHCEEITKELQKLDVLLMTSDHEGLPMILLESMSLQTPIIAHKVGGIPTLLDQGNCGILVSDHSISGYAQEIYRLAQDPEKRKNITQNALHRVRSHYSAKQNAQSYCEEYAILTSTS